MVTPELMKYKITPELITALKNLITVAEEHYDAQQIVDADDVIVLNSATEVKKLLAAWEYDKHVFEPYLHEEAEYLMDRRDRGFYGNAAKPPKPDASH